MQPPPMPPDEEEPIFLVPDTGKPTPEPVEVQWIRWLAITGGIVSTVMGAAWGIFSLGCCVLWPLHMAVGIYGLLAGIQAQSRRTLPPGHLAVMYIVTILAFDLITMACGIVIGFLQRSPEVLDWRYREAMRLADKSQ